MAQGNRGKADAGTGPMLRSFGPGLGGPDGRTGGSRGSMGAAVDEVLGHGEAENP